MKWCREREMSLQNNKNEKERDVRKDGQKRTKKENQWKVLNFLWVFPPLLLFFGSFWPNVHAFLSQKGKSEEKCWKLYHSFNISVGLRWLRETLKSSQMTREQRQEERTGPSLTHREAVVMYLHPRKDFSTTYESHDYWRLLAIVCDVSANFPAIVSVLHNDSASVMMMS